MPDGRAGDEDLGAVDFTCCAFRPTRAAPSEKMPFDIVDASRRPGPRRSRREQYVVLLHLLGSVGVATITSRSTSGRAPAPGPRDDTATGLAWFSLQVAPEILQAQQERLRQAGALAAAIANGLETSDPWGTKVRLVKV